MGAVAKKSPTRPPLAATLPTLRFAPRGRDKGALRAENSMSTHKSTAAINRARDLRKRMTPQEVKLWVRLRGLRAHGFHFRRQAPFDRYILDFVCFRYRLAIEVDGGQHGLVYTASRDQQRDARLAAEGFRVLRDWNSDIDRNLDGVLENIVAALTEASH
jgi:very-short-patch-repair endonuclease